jgi:hypothetical protein
VRWVQYAYAGTSRFREACRKDPLFTTVASGSAECSPFSCRILSFLLLTLATVCSQSTICMDQDRTPVSKAGLTMPLGTTLKSDVPPFVCDHRLKWVSVERSGPASSIPVRQTTA